MGFLEKARQLDSEHVTYRSEFSIPTFGSLGINSEKYSSSTKLIYFCGNSLGLMPLKTKQAISEELDVWSQRGVEGHFSHKKTPWIDIDLPLLPLMAPVVGAQHNEVAVMGSLTANLNALLVHFYRPKGPRTKILFEKQAFPSDYYAFLNLVQLAGYDESHLIQLEVKNGHTYLETQDILDAIDNHADELALVCLPGIQYYTGQLFDIRAITGHAKKYPEIVVGWDLAHAVGNAVLQLHDWNVDFAVWCSYKYLNAGPGGIAGIYVHENYTKDNSTRNFRPRLAGWWGNNAADRFKMLELFDPINSALSYRQSNPSVIDVVSLRSSLELIEKAGGIGALRKKSVLLTSYLLEILQHSPYYIAQDDPDFSKYGFRILTPLDPEQRGSQLSVLFQPYHEEKSKNVMEKVNTYLHQHGIICDERRPNVIRLAPTALYNTFEEVYYVGKRLNEAMAN